VYIIDTRFSRTRGRYACTRASGGSAFYRNRVLVMRVFRRSLMPDGRCRQLRTYCAQHCAQHRCGRISRGRTRWTPPQLARNGVEFFMRFVTYIIFKYFCTPQSRFRSTSLYFLNDGVIVKHTITSLYLYTYNSIRVPL